MTVEQENWGIGVVKPEDQLTQIPAHGMIHSWGCDGVTKAQSNSVKLWWDPQGLVPASSSGRGGKQELFSCLIAYSLTPSLSKVPVHPLIYVSRRTGTDQMTPANVSVGHEKFVCMSRYVIGTSITGQGRWHSTHLFLCFHKIQYSLPSGKLDTSWGWDSVALKFARFHWPWWSPATEQI